MRNDSRFWRSIIVLFSILLFLGILFSPASALAFGPPAPVGLENSACLECHRGDKKLQVPDLSPLAAKNDKRTLTPIPADRYGQGVHSRMACIHCHTGITNSQPPHQSGPATKVDCAGCHEKLSKSDVLQDSFPLSPRLEQLARNISNYRQSYHAWPSKDIPNTVNATCHECHDSHFFNVPSNKTGPEYAAWRMQTPELCQKCHEDQYDDYKDSIHGREVLDKNNLKSAVCIDCHTTHEIKGATFAVFKLLNPEACGQCHPRNLATYRDTFHGQISKLGYTYTAKCYDCHESHKTRLVQDKKAPTHLDNRLKTCQKCHDGKRRPLASAGFATFSPHAHSGDFDRYPQLWIATRFMVGLLLLVFTFFWIHSGLWYYREWQERKQAKPAPFVDLRALGFSPDQHVQRFATVWRLNHLLFALVVMILVLTGMSVLNAHSAWAKAVTTLLGGAENMGLIHRVCATLLLGIFFIHLLFVLQRLVRDRNFAWFGPDSLLPNWKDFTDCRDMFRWFFGLAPKPVFERWTYFEKFDYWAVFWGMIAIGGSGLLLAFPHVAGQYFEGWVFNVALVVHSTEAYLSTVFLFTVHFFNNHFRPDKLPPPDIVMFTGSQSLEEVQRDHPAHYLRLLTDGNLNKHLVSPPTPGMKLGSKILGFVLIALGLTLLVMVVQGFVQTL